MRFLVLALALLPSAALAQEKNPISRYTPFRAAECRNADLQWTRKAQTPAKPGTLADQPVADQYLTVLRIEDGCDRPVKIRQAIGDSADEQR
jgi:hypothetical protein